MKHSSSDNEIGDKTTPNAASASAGAVTIPTSVPRAVSAKAAVVTAAARPAFPRLICTGMTCN